MAAAPSSQRPVTKTFPKEDAFVVMAIGAHIKHGLCAVSASIFGFLYLTTIFICALVNQLIEPSPAVDKSSVLSKDEKKLVFDLEFYVKLYGFELEHHTVLTPDGYKLGINRLRAPDYTDNEEKPRYPLLLLPGLMQSSSAYCTAGPEAVGLVLSRLGYDVWLGNNRGGFRPDHVNHKRHSASMWSWSMQDLATSDVPAMVEYVKKQTGAQKIALGAHSQGTTQTFMALAREEHGGVADLGNSISSFSALAPAVFAGPLIDRWFLRLLRVGHRGYHCLMGYHAFVGMMADMRHLLPLSFFTYAAYVVFNYMLGWDDILWDRRYRNRNFIFAPVFVSAELMFWWLGKDGFADRKCIFKREDTKWFDQRFPPLEMYACGRDNLVQPEPLINRIYNYEPDVQNRHRVISLANYSHLDVLWAMDAGSRVAVPMANFAWENAHNKAQWKQPQLSKESTAALMNPTAARLSHRAASVASSVSPTSSSSATPVGGQASSSVAYGS